MTDHHDEAEAYRNRAERAEQELTEVTALAGYLAGSVESHAEEGCAGCQNSLAKWNLRNLR